MRRLGPRRLAVALERAAPGMRPAGALSLAQSAWPKVVGAAIASESEPVSERGGVITVACASAAWAQELEMLGGELLARLNAVLEGASIRVEELRFVVHSGAPGGAL